MRAATGLLMMIAPLAAQDRFEVFPTRTEWSVTYGARYSPPNSSGELLQGYPNDVFRGLALGCGDDCEIDGLFYQHQDQDGATPETYRLIARRTANSGDGPDARGVGLLFRTGQFRTPTSSSGVVAHVTTTTFATPVSLPCTGGLYVGVALSGLSMWPVDGQSIAFANYDYPSPFAPPLDHDIWYGDQPRSSSRPLSPAVNHAWYIVGDGATVARTSTGRTMRIGLFAEAAFLNVGNIDEGFHARVANLRRSSRLPIGLVDGSFGFGGVYPEVEPVRRYVRPLNAAPNIQVETYARSDGLLARVVDSTNLGAFAHVFIAAGVFTNGVRLPAACGRLFLDPTAGFAYVASMQILPTPVPVTGIGQTELIAPNRLSPALVGQRIYVQALIVDFGLSNLRFTNTQTIVF